MTRTSSGRLAALSFLAAATLGAACTQKNPYEAPPEGKPVAPAKVVGIDPEKFDCGAFLPGREVAAIVGSPVEVTASDFYAVAPGTPKPCTYVATSTTDAGDRAWGIYFDCRVTAQTKAGAELASYASQPDSLEVQGIGRKAMDHSRARVLFLDDDTPCAVGVVGPDAASRAAVARLAAQRLVPETAPMTVRSVATQASIPTPTP